MSSTVRHAPVRNQFGAFTGVFTPSILTILGVIMFMRANFVVGHAGVRNAVLILLIAKAITFLTAISISAISTNMQVRGGGAYYLISRVLGPEFGGAIGIALFLAVGLSVSFYVLGFSEALVRSVPALEPHFALVTFLAAGALFLIAYVGAGWALKTQFVIMTFLFLGIAAFLGGQVVAFSAERFAENWSVPGPDVGFTSLPFWTLFAIYFPAVTGILAGLNMSGDLRDASRSLPKGTLWAVGLGFAIYLTQILLGGGAYVREEMIATPFDLLRDGALWGAGYLVVGAVFAASLSSVLGSYLGAPRVLQAVARDRILSFLRPFAAGAAKRDEPRRALILTGLMTAAILAWANLMPGDALNSAASLITMFFLLSYGMINAAAFLESIVRNPSFRPTFRIFHWSLGAIGAALCATAAFLISPAAAAVATVLVGALYWHLRRKHLGAHFGDARRGLFFTGALRNLVRLSRMPEDNKNWRPAALVFSGNPTSREELLSYAVWLEAGHGIVLMASVLEGSIEDYAPHRKAALKQLKDFCAEKSINAFPTVVVAESREAGMRTLLQSAAVGPIRPNMTVFGWTKDPRRIDGFVRTLKTTELLGISAVLVECSGRMPEPKDKKRIDVWWRGRKNGSLMLMLAHLLTRNWEWAKTEVRLLRVVESADGFAQALDALAKLASLARLDVTPEIIVSSAPYIETLHEHSADATCVIMGFEPPPDGMEQRWYEGTSAMMADMPTTIMVSSQAQDIMV